MKDNFVFKTGWMRQNSAVLVFSIQKFCPIRKTFVRKKNLVQKSSAGSNHGRPIFYQKEMSRYFQEGNYSVLICILRRA